MHSAAERAARGAAKVTRKNRVAGRNPHGKRAAAHHPAARSGNSVIASESEPNASTRSAAASSLHLSHRHTRCCHTTRAIGRVLCGLPQGRNGYVFPLGIFLVFSKKSDSVIS